MSSQNTLVTCALDSEVLRPDGVLISRQFYRDKSPQGSGIYKAMNENGEIEIIGGPGSPSQQSIQFEDEGTNLGTPGTVTELDFTGIGITATRVGNKVTVNVPSDGAIPFGNDTDVAPNNIQVTLINASLTDGYTFEVRNLTTNTGPATLQTNALGVKQTVNTDGDPLEADTLIDGQIYLWAYDAINDRYELLGLSKSSSIPSVIGSSGATYNTINEAITGEASQGDTVSFAVVSGGVGTVTGPGTLSAIDNFYKNYWLVNTGTPTNGMQSMHAKVVSYNGTTKTFILDSPFNWVGEVNVTITKTIKISLLNSITEDVVLNSIHGVELNLSGCTITGSISVASGVFIWIRTGYVSDGIIKSNNGTIILDALTVSRSESSIYSFLINQSSTISRAVLRKCDFRGRVSARVIRMAWEIHYCRNQGVVDSQGNDLPYVMCESTGGLVLNPLQLSVQVTSEFSGSIFYADIASTISTVGIYLSVQGLFSLSKDFANPTQNASFQRDISIWRAHSSGVIACTVIPGEVDINYEGYGVINTVDPEASFSVIQAHELTGSISVVYNNSGTNAGFRFLGNNLIQSLAIIVVTGAATTTGNISMTGNLLLTLANVVGDLRCVRLDAQTTSTITLSNPISYITNGTNTFGFLYNDAVQNVGAPVVNISSSFSSTGGTVLGIVNLGTLTTLNFTLSGAVTANNVGDFQFMDTSLSGGIFQATGVVNVYRTGATSATTTAIARNNGTAGTISVTNTVSIVGGRSIAFTLVRSQGNGVTCQITGNVRISYLYMDGGVGLVQAFGTGSVARVTGQVKLVKCSFVNEVSVVQGNTATSSVTGPSSLVIDNCSFIDETSAVPGAGTSLSLVGRANLGPITWTNPTIEVFNTTFDGQVFLTPAPISQIALLEFTSCFFSGNQSSNPGIAPTKSIDASTATRPLIYRFWACHFRSRYNDLLPEVIYDWTIRPPEIALVDGQLATINSSANATDPVAASILEGVNLSLIASIANDPSILVRRGEIFVNTSLIVATGDNLILDAAIPVQATVGASVIGQRVGRALENSGTSFAGKTYTAVNLM